MRSLVVEGVFEMVGFKIVTIQGYFSCADLSIEVNLSELRFDYDKSGRFGHPQNVHPILGRYPSKSTFSEIVCIAMS